MSAAKSDDSTQRPLYGERIIEESKIICFEIQIKKEFMKFLSSYLNLHVSVPFLVIQILQS